MFSKCLRIVSVSLPLMGSSAFGAEYRIQPADALFAVLTFKDGIAAKLAHNHLVHATSFTGRVEYDETGATAPKFLLDVPVSSLAVDDPETQKKWASVFQALGLLGAPQGELSASDREKIKANMLDEGQLDLKKFPMVQAQVTRLAKGETKVGNRVFTDLADVSVTVKGKTVKKQVPAIVKASGSTIEVEALGSYQFSEFGIKPYSAMLGAVKNKNNFNVYVNFKAEKK